MPQADVNADVKAIHKDNAAIAKQDSNIAVNRDEKEAAKLISEGKKIAWFQGRLEYGPRALGCRSILADARNKETVDELNRIKSRESFRPFAISILEERASEWLVRGTKSPFMLLVDYV